MIYDLAVVGGGAAGSMGALRGVLNNLNTVCFLGDGLTKKKARATWVGKVENMPVLFNYPKAVFQSANEVFKWIADRPLWAENFNGVKDSVVEVTGEKGNFTLKTKKGESFQAKYVLLCTGVMDVQPLIQGDMKPVFPFANEGHIEYCIRCDGHRTKGKDTAIIGHQIAAPGIAALLKERYNCPSLTVLTNGKPLEMKEGTSFSDRVKKYGIEIKESPIVEFLGNPKGDEGMTGIKLEDGNVVKAQIAFVAMGMIVYNELAKALGCNVDERGFVTTDESGESTTPGVFIGGDLRADHKKQIYTAWDITVDAVDKVDSYIREEKRAALG